MNKSILTGRTTADITLRYTNGENSIAFTRFNLAVDRKGSKNKETDFITCQAWGKTAELLEKYVKKGDKVGIEGWIRTGSYEKDGHKVYTTEVVAESIEFMQPKGEKTQKEPEQQAIPQGFAMVEDDSIPF